jgi:rhodanese-related sulfurtransferase
VDEVDVAELARLRAAPDAPAILDVREPWEIAICAFPDSINIRMNELPAALDRLPSDRMLVVVCHHGMRSLKVAQWLRGNGFPNAVNLSGGIDAWARAIDPSVATY